MLKQLLIIQNKNNIHKGKLTLPLWKKRDHLAIAMTYKKYIRV